ncbi:MAG: ABC transporter ATP-binding protein [Candidatus Ranarchaeia archaeon]|jgi:putative ABC transport system ATP-binding protein
METEKTDLIVLLEKVEKTFHDNSLKDQYILKQVDLELLKGSFTGLTGPSGSGKTTLLHIIAGIEMPTTGRVTVLNEPLNDLSEDEVSKWRLENVGIVFQSYNLLSTLTARENIMFPLDLLDMDFEMMENIADDLLVQVGLQEHGDKTPSKLSGGEQQRLALARAIAPDPPLILLDEPSGNLDDHTRDQILEVLQNLIKQEKTILVATHDKAILSSCSKIHAIKGKTLQS